MLIVDIIAMVLVVGGSAEPEAELFAGGTGRSVCALMSTCKKLIIKGIEDFSFCAYLTIYDCLE